MRIDGVVFY